MSVGYRHPPPAPAIVASLAPGGGVTLRESYELCRRLAAAHGRTYYLAARLLPADQRRHVHALYAFARYADDLVDHLDLSWTAQRRRRALQEWSSAFLDALARGTVREPLLVAVVDTVERLALRHDDLRAFLASMAMDLTVSRYETFDDLAEYVHGSAAVIGTMMLPVLGLAPGADARAAAARARELGVAFQLTNFLRDVAEDWDRGRLYLPLEDLERFGVTEWDFRARQLTPAMRRLLAFEAARARALYRRAEEGLVLLAPGSQACVRVAYRLYGEILDRLERADWDVWSVRAHVPRWRKGVVAAAEVVRSRAAA